MACIVPIDVRREIGLPGIPREAVFSTNSGTALLDDQTGRCGS